MAVTYQQPRLIGQYRWRIEWSSDLGSPPPDGYRIYMSGVLVATTNKESWDVTLRSGESLVFEVLDDADLEPTTAFPGKLTIGWRRVSNAVKYRLEEYVASVWTAVKSISDDGSEWYSVQTRFLEDVTIHQHRIVPVDVYENDGTALSFSTLMVRHPDIPINESAIDDRFSYASGTNKVTISA